jgi:hypothetical protein
MPKNFPNGIAVWVLKAARLTYFFCDDAAKLVSKAKAIIDSRFIVMRLINEGFIV